MEKDIMYYALENAIRFEGRANPGAVLGKIVAAEPDAKKDMKETAKLVNRLVSDVNRLTPEQQKTMFAEIEPSKRKPEKKRQSLFSFLKIPEGSSIRTAFPPGTEKYPHIGHAKSCILNYMLAKEYNGKFVLRFEDTNPGLVKKEFYDIMQENLAWLGISWDELHYASDHMEDFMGYAAKLISKGKAYVCTCDPDKIKEGRMKSIPCSCRDRPREENMKLWESFPGMEEGKVVVRLKIDMTHKNSTMRDPAIFRINRTPHARQGKRYSAWPTYDFQTSVMDGINKITHRLRTKEFEMRNELQRWIQEQLGFPVTEIYEMARFNMEGVLSSGRIIREKIDKKELSGWDDPSLTTLVALRRRGFQPEAIWNFVVSTGITKSESTMKWDDLIMHNKRLLDRASERYFFVEDPIDITIRDAPELMLELKKHPEDMEKGYRKFKTKERFLISRKDYSQIKEGELWRLMDCLNFRKKGDCLVFDSIEHERFKEKGKRIIHWLPEDKGNINASVLMPDNKMTTGVAEKGITGLSEGQVIQFERFGFCRLDNRQKHEFRFTH
ncbi:glutamate--tRNA ligase [Candidatus Woesearchaeota archaeon]|nr:glutamate--tRNA ligase [Candidatus Woesearchaeota archaeon]